MLWKNKGEVILFKGLSTEAQELGTLLEREKYMIARQGNCLASLAVTFLISYIDEHLEAKSNSLFASEA